MLSYVVDFIRLRKLNQFSKQQMYGHLIRRRFQMIEPIGRDKDSELSSGMLYSNPHFKTKTWQQSRLFVPYKALLYMIHAVTETNHSYNPDPNFKILAVDHLIPRYDHPPALVLLGPQVDWLCLVPARYCFQQHHPWCPQSP